LGRQIFPLWGKWPEGPKGALFALFRFPREGGDPDLTHHLESMILIPAFARNVAERVVDEHPPLPTLPPPKGGKGLDAHPQTKTAAEVSLSGGSI
jgi:hypothetical protein